LKFPDLRENTGNFERKAPPRLLKPIETGTSLDEFPAIRTGNFLFQTGKDSANSELKMSACWREADIAAAQVHVR
jgi:hypothetical protein